MAVNLMTWNVSGIMSSSAYLCEVLESKSVDICGLSEHWLYEHDLHFFNRLDSGYKSYAIADSDLMLPSRRRVGKGGVAFMWKVDLDQYVVPIPMDDDRIICLQFEVTRGVYMYIFQIYLPCTNHSMDSIRSI